MFESCAMYDSQTVPYDFGDTSWEQCSEKVTAIRVRGRLLCHSPCSATDTVQLLRLLISLYSVLAFSGSGACISHHDTATAVCFRNGSTT
jgi:hypothetical protein